MERRQLLKTAVLSGAVITGTKSASAATDRVAAIDIQHSRTSSTVSGDDVNSEHLTVGTVDDELFEIGGSADRSLRIVNTETGETVTFEPSADEETYATNHLTIFTGASGTAPASNYGTEIDIRTPERSDYFARLEGTYSGDTGLFAEQTFAPYIVELLDGTGNVIASTDEKVYGINYEWEFEQRGSTATITRDPEVDDDWLVEFEVENDSSSDTLEVSHGTDDVFEIPLDELHVPEGEYEWTLRIYAGPYAERETLAIRLLGSDDHPVVVEDFSGGSTDESDTGSESDTDEEPVSDAGEDDESGDDEPVSDAGEDEGSEDDESESDTDEDAESGDDGVPGLGSVAAVGGLAGGYALSRHRSDDSDED